jgi:hypothetical protein
MTKKKLKDEKIWTVNGFKFNIEFYDSELIIKDDNDNCMRISKKDTLSILLDLKGSFKSD